MSAHALSTASTIETSHATPAASLLLQKKCAACANADHEAENDNALVQKRSAGQAGGSGFSLVDAALSSPGQPLDSATRHHMEGRFGRDFSNVRVRDDTLAYESARSVDALAYTVGNDVVFGAGQYRPHTPEGSHLLAHELAHTVQQGGLQRRAAGQALGSDPIAVLEAEADRAADAAVAPQSGPMPSLTRLSTPVLARAKALRDWGKTPITVDGVEQEDMKVGGPTQNVRAFRIKMLTLPPGKGYVADKWNARAEAGELEATVEVAGNTKAIKDVRPLTDPLRGIWLQNLGWDDGTLATQWQVAGGSAKLYSADGVSACHIDHKIELQFGGNNTKENLALLDGDHNVEAGRTLWGTISKIANDIDTANTAKGRPKLDQIILSFGGAKAPGGMPLDKCQAVETKLTELKKGPGKLPGAAGNAKDGKQEKPLAVGTNIKTTVWVAASGKGSIVDALATSDIDENKSASSLVPGMTLKELHRKTAGPSLNGTIEAEINDTTKSRQKIDIPSGTAVQFDVKNGAMSLSASLAKSGIKFNYPYLSPGELTKIENGSNGLSADGVIHPSIPLFGPLGVHLTPDSLKVTKGLGLAGKKSPIPGFKITKDELALELAPEFKPSGRIDFAVGPDAKPIADGFVEAGVEGSTFAAHGTLNAHIPGVDDATGKISYTKGAGWVGKLEVKTSKIPGTSNVNVVVSIGPDGLAVEGGMTIVLPGSGNSVTLGFEHQRGKYVLKGGTQLTIPVKGLDPVDVEFEHDGTHLTGGGKAKLAFHGLQGDLHIAYYDGKIGGHAAIHIQKNKAKGDLKVNLNDKNKLSGEGSITYDITKDLIATAGIVLHEDESVTLKGALEIAKPIQLFAGSKGQKNLLSLPTITIPIPGASIGPVGLVIKIDGGIDIHYQVGPGELRNTKVEATFNPLDEKPDLDILMGAQLYVGAHAGIGGHIRGAIAIDAKIASVSGGLTVGAQADLDGKAQADLKLHYTKSRFEFDAKGLIAAGLSLGLSLDADVSAQAGIGPFTAEWKKVWHLAAYKLDTGLQFGLEAPLHYASDQPFKAPSLDDIKWILPKLDAQTLLDKAMHSASASEKKS